MIIVRVEVIEWSPLGTCLGSRSNWLLRALIVFLLDLKEFSRDTVAKASSFRMENIFSSLQILNFYRFKVILARGWLLKSDCTTDGVRLLVVYFQVWRGYDIASTCSSLLRIELAEEVLLSSLNRVRVRKVKSVKVVPLLVQVWVMVPAPGCLMLLLDWHCRLTVSIRWVIIITYIDTNVSEITSAIVVAYFKPWILILHTFVL